MKTYYIPTNNWTEYETMTEDVYLSVVGNEKQAPYASKLYHKEITAEDIPDELRESVVQIVANKVKQWGEYADRIVPSEELRIMIETTINGIKLKRKEAEAFIAGIIALRNAATDKTASEAVQTYPTMKYDSTLIETGTRINWNSKLKRAAVDLWDVEENNPDNAPSLWENIDYKDGYRIIPETITVGLAFALDECGWWGDTLYKSKLANNTYTPKQYPAGWEIVDNN